MFILAAGLTMGATKIIPPGTGSSASALVCNILGGALCIDAGSGEVSGGFLPYPKYVEGLPVTCDGQREFGFDTTFDPPVPYNCRDGEDSAPIPMPQSNPPTVCGGAAGLNCVTPTSPDYTLTLLGGSNVTIGTPVLTGSDLVEVTLTATDSATKQACTVLESAAAADDNMLFASFVNAVTITSVWCNYAGAAPVTAATFTIEDGAGNAMTITGTNPTCGGPGSAATAAAVTAANTLLAREVLRFDITNTPDPATDTYMLCVGYTQ